jgi:hypothetical protein
MAIFPDLPGFEAKVVVNGAVCQEYSSPEVANEDESNMVTRYIEATPGARFEVRVRVRQQAMDEIEGYDICAWVNVDGQAIMKPLWRQHPFSENPRTVQGLDMKYATGWTRRDLVFSNLNKGI